ncbi:amidohydrolase family protein [Ceratobasidium sp. AG-Ba]|nr:amidohydrolase family protein [Ceratobasidium sp. AG-Ba]
MGVFGTPKAYDLGRPRTSTKRIHALGFGLLTFTLASIYTGYTTLLPARHGHIIPQNAEAIIQRCARMKETPNRPPSDRRIISERCEPDSKMYWLYNATVWTGIKDATGRVEVFNGDILMFAGVIQGIHKNEVGSALDEWYKKGLLKPRNICLRPPGDDYNIPGLAPTLEEVRSWPHMEIIELDGAWITPAIFDMHSHVGVASLPGLRGAGDDNSMKSPIMPFLRSFDGINTHDDAYELFRAGGVATSLILPGSADNIGGQAAVIKLGRATRKRGPSSMVLEPPDDFFVNVNKSNVEADYDDGVKWRHIKHACGENPSGVYSQTRMDSVWKFRQAYDKARQVMHKQNDYCESAEAGRWDDIREQEFPQDLEYEALVDVLRGKVKVHIHCYEAVDFDGMVRLSNEFKFPIAAFHHAHESYLVPDLVKKAWGKIPALALFSTFARYKREAYRGSEFAPKILNENDLRVIMKSDGPPAINARYLMYEAALAHYYGLPADVAIASLTTTPAEVSGYDHRLGFIKPGYDADVIVWDSYPLALGATPKQVFIDALPQLDDPAVIEKPAASQKPPSPPSWDQEAQDALASDGTPDLLTPKEADPHTVIFTNVSLFIQDDKFFEFGNKGGVVVATRGNITCASKSPGCDSFVSAGTKRVDLEGGSVLPGLVSFGSAVGLVEIDQEPSTNDGPPPDPLNDKVPKVAGGDDLVVRAVDGLSFSGRNALLAHRGGVTTMVEAPSSYGLIQGISVAFRTGSSHGLEPGAISQQEVALHARIVHDGVGDDAMVSTKVATLRRLLLSGLDQDKGGVYARVVKGQLPLVVSVEKADIMATLIQLKADVEDISDSTLHLVFAGATESHLLAQEIAGAGVSVILAPLRSFPRLWDQKRYIPGPPLSIETPLGVLRKAGVTVGLGVTSVSVTQAWDIRSTRFNLGWAISDSGGSLNHTEAWALSTSNMKKQVPAN